MFQAAEPTPHHPCSAQREEQDLFTRVQAEFREMPGNPAPGLPAVQY